MAAKDKIVQIGNGRKTEVTLNTGITPKPGQHIMLNLSGVGILPTYANGAIEELLLLEENYLLAGTVREAFPDSANVNCHIPVAGDEVLVLVPSGQTIIVGDLGVVQTATGKVIKTAGTEPTRHYKFLAASGGALAADTLILARKL